MINAWKRQTIAPFFNENSLLFNENNQYFLKFNQND